MVRLCNNWLFITNVAKCAGLGQIQYKHTIEKKDGLFMNYSS